MRVQLAQQAQESLGPSDLVLITERVDDVALLIGPMVKMGVPEVLDRHIPRHWTQRGRSFSPDKSCYTLSSLEDLTALLHQCSSDVRQKFEREFTLSAPTSSEESSFDLFAARRE